MPSEIAHESEFSEAFNTAAFRPSGGDCPPGEEDSVLKFKQGKILVIKADGVAEKDPLWDLTAVTRMP